MSETKPEAPKGKFLGSHAFLNQAQLSLLEFYSTGDFEYLIKQETKESFDEELENCGDTFLIFMVTELSEKEDCADLQTAFDRTNRVLEDVQAILRNFEKIPEEEGA